MINKQKNLNMNNNKTYNSEQTSAEIGVNW